LKEVEIHDLADFPQGIGINPRIFEDAINILPRALQLGGEPSHATTLSVKFFFDEVSDMWRFIHNCLLIDEPISCKP
jgi:hypothetical protein